MLLTLFEKPNMKSGHSRKVAPSMKLFTETENGLSWSSEIITIAIATPTVAPTTAPLMVLVMIRIDASITARGENHGRTVVPLPGDSSGFPSCLRLNNAPTARPIA